MAENIEKSTEPPIPARSYWVLLSLMGLSLVPTACYLLQSSGANAWSSNLVTILALALSPFLAIPLLFVYGLAMRIPNHQNERVALFGLVPCLLMAAFYGIASLVSLPSGTLEATGLLNNLQINSFSRAFLLCLATVFLLNLHHKSQLSTAPRIWLMPVLLVFGLAGLQVLDLRTGMSHEYLKTIVGISALTSIFNAALLTKIGRDKQNPVLLSLAWVAVLQLINQLLFLAEHGPGDTALLLFTQTLNDFLAFLVPVPFLTRSILRQMSRPFSAIPSANQIQDSQGLPSAEAFAQGVAQAKSQLLSKLSHEFKTPLNTIIGYSELLVDELEEANMPLLSDDLHKVNRAGWYLMTLVDDLLDVSSLDGNAFKLRENNFDAERFVQILHKMAEKIAAPHMIEIKSFCQKDFGLVRADEARLLQVCMNVLRNAVRYTHSGEISLHFYSIIKSNERFFSIDIRDSGRGMDPQQIAHIFSAFESIENDSWEAIYGMSLGLPVTKKLCELMGGSLSVDSAPGKGTTFSLTFPHHGNKNIPCTHRVETELTEGPILLIDDDEEYTGFMREIFESAGLPTLAVSKARSALRVYLEKKPSVILVDLKMPEIDGYSVIQSIRDQDPHCLIITVSGEGLESSEEQSRILGSDHFFEKPMAIEAVLRSIEKRKKSAA